MPLLHIIIASTRQERKGPLVANWFHDIAQNEGNFEVELIDLAKVNLPLFDEPRHPSKQEYEHEHTVEWARIVDRADAYALVTPEYNHGSPPSLLNALNFVYKEWQYKPVGFVSYGGVSGGTRSAEMTKTTITTLKMMPIPEAVSIPFFSQYIDDEGTHFSPPDVQQKAANKMLKELLKWSNAMKALRS